MRFFSFLTIILLFPFSALAADISLQECQKETELTAKDCFYMESFDKEKKICTSRIPQQSGMKKAISKRMTKIAQYTPEFSEQRNALSFDETQNIVTYEIFGNIIANRFPHPNEKLLQLYGDIKIHWKVWKTITKMYPKKYREELQLFRIFSDGVGNETARVGTLKMPRQKNTTAWGIAIDPADSDDLPYTLLHELAHVITDSTDERAQEAKFRNCINAFGVEKISIRNAYFPLFADEFWSDSVWSPPSGGGIKGGIGDSPEAGIFSGKEEQDVFDSCSIPLLTSPAQGRDYSCDNTPLFITDYATTNAVEDFAETFAHFVLLEKPETNCPPHDKGDTGSESGTGLEGVLGEKNCEYSQSILNQKLLFFWQFEETQRLRESLRFGVLMLVGK